jgi:NADH-quinone oxidoreductase subunit N
LESRAVTVDQTLQQVFRLAVPEAALVGVACVLFLLSTVRAANRNLAGLVALVGIAFALGLHDVSASAPAGIRTVSPLVIDDFATFVRLTALATGAVLAVFCWRECDDRHAADFHACLLTATAGFSLVGAANDLVVVFLALELISIPTYVMLYLPRGNDPRAQEAAVKYFLLSVMSSALTLFGFSYLYGLGGTTNLAGLTELLPRLVPGEGGVAGLVAGVLIFAGLGFRITAFPFHFYAPDVYQGGPTGTVAFLSFVPKLAGFAALLKLFAFLGAFHPTGPDAVGSDFVKRVMLVLWVLAAVTMTVGNAMGLLQTNVRRMLAYSSVANAGYMLIGLAVIPAQDYRGTSPGAASGGEALLFYLIAYGAMTIGAFAVLAYLDSPAKRVETVDDLAGVWQTHPWAAALMAVCLISLIGLPLTAGFVGKFWLFVGALAAPAEAPMQVEFRVLAVIGAVNAAIAAYYYVRVIMSMYLRSSLAAPVPTTRAHPALLAAGICVAMTVVFGIYPKPLQEACWRAFEAVRAG